MEQPRNAGADDDAEAQRMEAFERLAGGIAHDFNNFLTSILATADLALATPALAPAVRADLESIREAGKRAAATTRRLLMFSRKQVGQPRPTDLNELVGRMESLLRRLLPPSVSLDIQRGATGFAEADPAQIEQVLVDLVRNAVDAMPAGGSISVATADLETHKPSQIQGRTMLPGRYIVLRVRDTGHGMDDATRQRIFEPYFTTKRTAPGAGLGLSAVHGIIQNSGGHIVVNSRPGEGSLFEICLPRVDAARSEVSSTQGIVVGGGEVLLVIENEPTVRAPICRALRQLGYFVLEARDADDALHVLQEYHAPVHLVVVDVSTQSVNAMELVALLQGWYPAIRVLFISGQDEGLDSAIGELPPGARMMPKPFSAKRLTLMVRSLLDEKLASQEYPDMRST